MLTNDAIAPTETRASTSGAKRCFSAILVQPDILESNLDARHLFPVKASAAPRDISSLAPDMPTVRAGCSAVTIGRPIPPKERARLCVQDRHRREGRTARRRQGQFG